MSLRSELQALEESLSITSPVACRAQAFLSVPGRELKLAQRRAVFENIPFAPREVGQMGDFQELIETVRVRFTAYDAHLERAIEIADAFKAVFVNAIAYQRVAGRRLNGSFDYVAMQEVEEQFQAFEEGRPGWQLELDFTVFRTVVAP